MNELTESENPIPKCVVNGRRYSLWPQFVQRKAEWIGGILEDLDAPTARTTITDITFGPNGKESAMFGIVGEDFTCCCDVHYLAVDPDGETGWLTLITRFGTGFRFQKPNAKTS